VRILCFYRDLLRLGYTSYGDGRSFWLSSKRGANLEEAKDDKHQLPCFDISILIPRPGNKKKKHEISSDCVYSACLKSA